MRVLILNRFAEQYRDRLAPRWPEVEIVAATREEEFARAIADTDVLVAWKFPLKSLATAERLRWIQVLSAGVDHLGDLGAIDERVTLTTCKGMHGDLIADYVLAMLLALAWRVPQVVKNQERKTWHQLPARPLAGRRAGIVGLGHVGGAVARQLHAVGMRVLGSKRTVEAVPGVERVYPAEQLGELLAAADAVVLTVPLTADTRGLIGERELRGMKPGSHLINVSRGHVLDYRALSRALREGLLAGAACDVFPEEPLVPDSDLWETPI